MEPKQLQLLRHDVHVFDIVGLLRVQLPQTSVYRSQAAVAEAGLEHLRSIARWLGDLVAAPLPWLMLPTHLALFAGALLVQYVRVAFAHRHPELADQTTFDTDMGHFAALYEVAVIQFGLHKDDLQAAVLWIADRCVTSGLFGSHQQQHPALWNLDASEVAAILAEAHSLFPASVGQVGRLMQHANRGHATEASTHSLRKPWLTARDCDAVLDYERMEIIGSITNDVVAIKV